MVFRFGTFEFDDQSNELRRNGRAVALEPQPARALARLLARPGEVVTREELRDAVWGGDTHVDFERGLAYCLSQIRAALGDSGENPRFVQTLPKRGYKFIAPVSRGDEPLGSPGPVAANTILPRTPATLRLPLGFQLAGGAALLLLLVAAWAIGRPKVAPPTTVIIGVSIFDNETGLPEHDRLVAGLSDLVVARLAGIDPDRIAVVGNATVLRQPRNIRNLKAVAESLRADYVLLGQLQRGDEGLRFITHVIRLRDEAHLKANRLYMPGGGVTGLETEVVAEFDRAVRKHVLDALIPDP